MHKNHRISAQKEEIKKIVEKSRQQVLFQTPYSLDFNKIEQDFAIIKKRRIYAPADTSLDDIIKAYGT